MNVTTTKLYLSMAMELLHVATDKDLETLRDRCEQEIQRRNFLEVRREAKALLYEVEKHLRPDVGGPYNNG